MLPRRIKSFAELVTSHQATCNGFREQATVKAQKAAPYIQEANQFWKALKGVQDKADILGNETLRHALISTAGVSAKARKYLTSDEINEILAGIVQAIQAEREGSLREEIFYRYLLTRGASLDGEMRNYVGAEAARVLVGTLLNVLEKRNDPLIFLGKAKTPKKLPEARALVQSQKVTSIEWGNRKLVFDRKPKIIGKNVDVILLDTFGEPKGKKHLLEALGSYLACGELKGGIDPAGADEHWKTAKSALERISSVFAGRRKKPALFFVAAAIEASMAREIFSDLEKGNLNAAANLTVAGQVADLAVWLVSL